MRDKSSQSFFLSKLKLRMLIIIKLLNTKRKIT